LGDAVPTGRGTKIRNSVLISTFSESLAQSGIAGFRNRDKNTVIMRVCGLFACVLDCIFTLWKILMIVIPGTKQYRRRRREIARVPLQAQ